MLKIVLIIVMFGFTPGSEETMYYEFNTMDECKVAADTAIKAMAEQKEIKDGFAVCTGKVRLVKDGEITA
jgi:hypothetical protein